jgi:hypothetical protein
MNKQRKPASNFMLICLSCLVVLAIGELSIRYLFPQKTLFPRYVLSDEYQLMLPGNSTLVHAQGNLWKFTYQTNEFGHRGKTLPATDRDKTTNIVALGDSFTFGMGVNERAVYTHTLHQQLGQEYFVFNTGMSGWGIDSAIKRYYEISNSYNPKYVIVQFTQNDLSDSVTGVTAISDGEFIFTQLSRTNPWWQEILSKSYILQSSQIYAMARTIAENHMAESSAEQSSGSKEYLLAKNYIDMLNLFAKQLQAQDIELLFLSVTHRDADAYHYDLDHFDEIGRAVVNMESAGLLQIIDLPLDELESYRGSPEGHQWGPQHHKIVGKKIAATIQQLESPNQYTKCCSAETHNKEPLAAKYNARTAKLLTIK